MICGDKKFWNIISFAFWHSKSYYWAKNHLIVCISKISKITAWRDWVLDKRWSISKCQIREELQRREERDRQERRGLHWWLGWDKGRTSLFDGTKSNTQERELSSPLKSVSRDRETLQFPSSRSFLVFSRFKKKSGNSGLVPFPLLQSSKDPDGSLEGGSRSLRLSFKVQRLERKARTVNCFLGTLFPA